MALYGTTGDHFEFYDSLAKVQEASDLAAAHFQRCLNSRTR
jgi:hypothetical protein